MRARMETAAAAQAREGIGVSPNSSAIHCVRRPSVTSSNWSNCAVPCATSSKREAGLPEIVNRAIATHHHRASVKGSTGRIQLKLTLWAIAGACLHAILLSGVGRNLHSDLAEALVRIRLRIVRH